MSFPSLNAALAGLDGLLAGVFIGSSMVEHAARALNASSWIAYKHAKEAVFGPVMPPVFLTCMLATIAAAFILPAHGLLGGAAALLVVVFAITAKVHLPLNKVFLDWSAESHPASWDKERSKWRDWNIARTGLTVAAFGLVLTTLT